MIGRRKPYTALGISRVPCVRCGAPSVHQWQICAMDNVYVACCAECDVQLNEVVLEFMRIPDAESLALKYRRAQGVMPK